LNKFITEEQWVCLEPHAMRTYQCTFDVNHYCDSLYSELGVPLPPGLVRAVPKRKAEFLVGRYAGRVVLGACGFDCLNIETSPDRSPCWPLLTVGSITHSDKIAPSCAARRGRIVALGIDIEGLIDKEVARGIGLTVIDSAEVALLRYAEAVAPAAALTLAFSAKEQLYTRPYIRR
jgi:4'-phosphopantetheinyl transferase EntD